MGDKAAELRDLMAAAVAAPLEPEQQQDLLADLVGAEPELVIEQCGLRPRPPDRLVELIENNKLIALQALIALGPQITDYLPALLESPATVSSVAVVNRLTESADLPREFLISFASHAIDTCEAAFVNYEEDEELAKITAVLASDLITNGHVGLRDIGTQAQGFAIDYVDLEEASQLLNTLVQAGADEEEAAYPESEPEPEPEQGQGQGGSQPALSPLQHQSLRELIEGSVNQQAIPITASFPGVFLRDCLLFQGDFKVIPALEYARLVACEEELRSLKPRL